MSNQDPYQGKGSSSPGGTGGRLPWSDSPGVPSSEVNHQNIYDGGVSSSAGDVGSRISQSNFAGFHQSEYAYQPTYPAPTTMTHEGASYYGRGFAGTSSAGGQPPYNLGGAAHPSYMEARQPTHSAGASMSYPETTAYGRGFNTAVDTSEQGPYNAAALAYPGIYGAGNTNNPLETGMVPRSGVGPQIGYGDQYPSQSLDDRDIGTRQQFPPNRPPAQPHEGRARKRWYPDENARFVEMCNSGVPWRDIAEQMGCSEAMCQNHKRHLDRKEAARAEVEARAHQGGGEGHAGSGYENYATSSADDNHKDAPQADDNYNIGPFNPNKSNELPSKSGKEPRNAKWDPEEDEKLLQLYDETQSYSKVAEALHRTYDSCKGRRLRLLSKMKVQSGNEAIAAAPAPEDVPILRMNYSGISRVDWAASGVKDQSSFDWETPGLNEWVHGRLEIIRYNQNGGPWMNAWHVVAEELNEKNNTNIKGEELRRKMPYLVTSTQPRPRTEDTSMDSRFSQ